MYRTMMSTLAVKLDFLIVEGTVGMNRFGLVARADPRRTFAWFGERCEAEYERAVCWLARQMLAQSGHK